MSETKSLVACSHHPELGRLRLVVTREGETPSTPHMIVNGPGCESHSQCKNSGRRRPLCRASL
jgi:hypothetical protein